MLLQEEYLTRHGISDVPLIRYIKNGSLLMRCPESWVLMVISWQDPRNHPGKFHINFFRPVHNSWTGLGRISQFFVPLLKEDLEIEWDDFHDYVLGKPTDSAVAITGEIELDLASWEVFSFCIDNWLTELADSEIRKLHFASVDLESSQQERHAAYQDALSYLSKHYQYMFKSFNQDFKCYLQNYCHWLGKLRNDLNKISI